MTRSGRVSVISAGTVQIHPDHLACTWQPTFLWVLTSRQWTTPRPINVYIIEHRDGLVLFDTGQDRASVTDRGYFPSGLLMGLLYRMSRFDMAADQTLSILLEGIGYRAGNVGTVVLSHLHGDHIGGLRELSHAELLVSRAEWHTLSGPWPEAAGVLRRHIRLPGLRWRQIEPAPIHDPSLAPFDTAMLNQLRETHPGLVVLATHDPGAAAARRGRDRLRSPMDKTAFPVGLHPLHQDVSMNFQMNRWFSWVGEPGMLDEMRSVAPRITNYVDWKREFLALAENAKREGHVLRAGFYFRAADFFMRTDDPDRRNARGQFLSAMRSVYGLDQLGRHEVRYAAEGVAGVLPAYRFTPSRSKGTIVFFGGFDSYIEELTSAFFFLRDAGYEVIAFEGPGQGGALNDAGLHMTAAWHRSVKAVLDHFKLDHVTLAGLSMGGCLVMRAAAFEPRVDRVVAYDVYPDALDTTLRQVNTVQRVLLKMLLKLRAARVVNAVARRAARKSPIAQWGLEEGMHVTGSSSPYGYFQSTKTYVTADVSAQIKQDVLLLAGSEDHLVPMAHFYRQIEMLKNARSITARLFTTSESAASHCQVGNYGLAFRTIVNWLDGMQGPDIVRPPTGVATARLRNA